MKPRFGNILMFFLITMILMSIFYTSNERKFVQVTHIDAANSDKIFVGHTVISNNEKQYFQIYWGVDDSWEISELEFGKFISLDVKAANISVLTDNSCIDYQLKKDKQGEFLERKESINITDVYSLVPYEQRSLFPAPKVESCILSPKNSEDKLFCFSQSTDQEVRLILSKNKQDGSFIPVDIPVLKVLAEKPRILKFKLIPLNQNGFLVSMLIQTNKKTKLIMAMQTNNGWEFLDKKEFADVVDFACAKLENHNIEFLLQTQKKFYFLSLVPEITANKKITTYGYDNLFVNPKIRKATVPIDTESTFSIAGLKDQFHVFTTSENLLYQSKLINWENGVFSDPKQIKYTKKASSEIDLSQFWVLIIFVLGIVLMVILFAILRTKKTFKNILDPVNFVEEAKLLQAKKTENTDKSSEKLTDSETEDKSSRNSYSDTEKIKLITKTGVERPEKNRYPDFTDPFSIFEHWGYIPAGLLVRVLAAGIDLLLLAPMFYGVGQIMDIRIDDLFSGPDWLLGHIIIMVVHLIYFVFMEYYFGKSLGKMFVGIKVKTVDNKTADFKSILIRNLTRIPDYYLFIAIFFSLRAQRIGDRIAKTVVIHDTKVNKET